MNGKIIDVLCVPLSSILRAINYTKIDLLTINTGGDNDDTRIGDVLTSSLYEIKVISFTNE